MNDIRVRRHLRRTPKRDVPPPYLRRRTSPRRYDLSPEHVTRLFAIYREAHAKNREFVVQMCVRDGTPVLTEPCWGEALSCDFDVACADGYVGTVHPHLHGQPHASDTDFFSAVSVGDSQFGVMGNSRAPLMSAGGAEEERAPLENLVVRVYHRTIPDDELSVLRGRVLNHETHEQALARARETVQEEALRRGIQIDMAHPARTPEGRALWDELVYDYKHPERKTIISEWAEEQDAILKDIRAAYGKIRIYREGGE